MKRAIKIAKRLTASFFSITSVMMFVTGLFRLDCQMMASSIAWMFIGGGFGVSIVTAFEEMYNEQQLEK